MTFILQTARLADSALDLCRAHAAKGLLSTLGQQNHHKPPHGDTVDFVHLPEKLFGGLGLRDPRAALLVHHLNDIRAALWAPPDSAAHNAYAVPINYILAHPTEDSNFWTMRNILKEIAHY